MNKKMVSGTVGVVVGGALLANNIRHFEEQGFVAIGMPLILLGLGALYLLKGLKASKSSEA